MIAKASRQGLHIVEVPVRYRPRSGGNRSGCSHVVAAYDYLEHERTVSAWTDEDQAKRQHRPTLAIGDGVTLTSRKAGT